MGQDRARNPGGDWAASNSVTPARQLYARAARAGYRADCPINIALEAFGDTWSLLIVRDLMFKNRRTFKVFLGAEEEIATNILSDRLVRLEALGIVHKLRGPADGRPFVYSLPKKGRSSPVLVERLWSATHEETAAPPDVVREMLSDRQSFIVRVRAEWAKNEQAGTGEAGVCSKTLWWLVGRFLEAKYACSPCQQDISSY